MILSVDWLGAWDRLWKVDVPASRKLRRKSAIESLEHRCLLSRSNVWFEVAPTWNDATALNGPSHDWIVRFTRAAATEIDDFQELDALIQSPLVGFQAVRGLEREGLVLVRSTGDTALAQQALKANVAIEHVDADATVTGQLVPNDTFFGNQHDLVNNGQNGAVSDADIDAELAWDVTTGSSSVVVALIDSGVDYTHPDLYLNIWINPGELPGGLRPSLVDSDADGAITFRDLNAIANASFVTDINQNGFIDAGDLLNDPRWENGIDEDLNFKTDDLIGWDYRDNDNDPLDTHGHGTHVAGTIGASGNNGLGIAGLNWRASLMPLRFLASEPGQGLTGSVSHAIMAIDYTTRQVTERGVNVRVSNNSWGTSNEPSDEFRRAVEENGAADVLLVAAAGNGTGRTGLGIDLDDTGLAFYPASFPFDNVVSVAAVDFNDKLAIFSQHGAASVDLAAPGVSIFSSDLRLDDGARFSSRSGTSMAAPHVAGTAALIVSSHPDATVLEIRQALLQSVDVKPALQGRVATGGRLNANNAVRIDVYAPRATLASAPDVASDGAAFYEFQVQYRDNVDLDLETLGNSDAFVTPAGNPAAPIPATISDLNLDADPNTPGSQPLVTYRITPPGGTWDRTDNGRYEVRLTADAISDTRTPTPNETKGRVLGDFEVSILYEGEILVTSFGDGADTNPADGISNTEADESTLRSAIQTANVLPGLNTLVLQPGRYELTLLGADEDAGATGDLDITGDLLIRGNGAVIEIIDGLDRVLDVFGTSKVTLENVTIAGGSVLGSGGGLRNTGGEVTITGSLFTRNAATNGGAIANLAGSVSLTNSTLSTNTSTDAAGLDVSGGSATLLHVTMTANAATNEVGGVNQSGSSSISLINTLIAGNTAPTNSDVAGDFAESRSSLIGIVGTATGLVHGTNGNQVGTTEIPLDPQLGPLADNGGLTKTHELNHDSPAIDQATSMFTVSLDQRGIARPQNGDRDAFPESDIGASERYRGQISGVHFNDTNANGVRDVSELGVPGFTVYLDMNANGVLDAGEPTAITSEENPETTELEVGQYEFRDILSGQYLVREASLTNWDATAPRRNPEEALTRMAELNGSSIQDAFDGIKLSGTFGFIPQPIGDFNGDGVDDLLIRRDAISQEYGVIFGGSRIAGVTALNLATTPVDVRIFSATFAFNINGSGDYDGDGFSDIFIRRSNLNTEGYVIRGGAVPITDLALDSLHTENGHYGYKVTGSAGFLIPGGDINGDGRFEFVSGDSQADPLGRTNAGQINVYFTPANPGGHLALDGLAADQVLELRGAFSGDQLHDPRFGMDLNEDGIGDLVVSAFQALRDGTLYQESYVIAGRESWPASIDMCDVLLGSVSGWIYRTSQNDGLFDINRLAHDYNGNGIGDSAVAVSSNIVKFYDGSVLREITRQPAGLVARPQPSATSPYFDDFQHAGDFDGDGIADVIYGSSNGRLLNEQETGIVIIEFGVSGAFPTRSVVPFQYSTTIDASRNAVFAGQFQERLGSPAFIGDITGDGFDDFFARSDSSGGSNAGYFVFGGFRRSAIARDNHWRVFVPPAAHVEGIDFGSSPIPGVITGSVFLDLNQDRLREVDEPGLQSVLVFMDQNANGTLDVGERSVVSDSLGRFELREVTAAVTHRIRIVSPVGFTQTGPDEVANFEYVVTPQPGETIEGLNFGLADNAGGVGLGDHTISGTLFSDLDQDRVRDGDEVGLPNITVYLDLNDNGVLDDTPVPEPRTVSAADNPATGPNEAGTFEFAALEERDYVVRLILPEGAMQTSPTLGAFQATTSTGGQGPAGSVFGNFNGDAIPDMIVVTGGLQDVRVHLGAANGTFVAGQSVVNRTDAAKISDPQRVAGADFNGDGRVDLVVGNRNFNTPTVYLHNGAGAFATRTMPALGSSDTSAVAVGAFDTGNTSIDMVVASEFGNSIYVLTNDGSGNFTLRQTLALASQSGAVDLVAADFNNDGRTDFAIAQRDKNTVRVYLQQAAGLFSDLNPGNVYTKSVGNGPYRLAAGDLNGDGFADLVVANVFDTRISVLMNRGTGVFDDAHNLQAGNQPAAVAIGDFNNDARPDIVVATASNVGFSVFHNLGGGVFQAPTAAGVGTLGDNRSAPTLLVQDVDADSNMDLILVEPERDAGTIYVERNTPAPNGYRVRFGGALAISGLSFGVLPPITLQPTSVSLNESGQLLISDLNATGRSDRLTLSVVGSDLMIADPSSDLTSTVGTTVSAHEIRVPLPLITGNRVLVSLGSGDDVFDGSSLSLTALALVVEGGNGNDTLRGGAANDTLSGGDGLDVIFGNAGADSLMGGLGNDELRGGAAKDTLNGGDGVDLLFGDTQDDVLTGGRGDDAIDGGTGNDSLRETGDGNATLSNSTLTFLISGATEIDALSGLEAATLIGGLGANRLDATAFTGNLGVVLDAGGAGADTLLGSALNDTLLGGIGADSLVGGDGHDSISGSSGADTVSGGNGNDSITGAAGSDRLFGDSGNDTIFGGTSNDTLDGGSGNDVLNGQDNDDSLVGQDGDDKLNGGAGNDTVVGSAGVDSLIGDTGNDLLDGGVGADRINGSAGNDLLLGGSENDSLFGDLGSDTLDGGTGDDQLRGGPDVDDLDGGPGTDRMSEEADSNFTIVGLQITSVATGTETVRNLERFNILGGTGNNVLDARQSSVRVFLYGFGGNDTLVGSNFDDLLVGGEGNDVLTGGSGTDALEGNAGMDYLSERVDADVTINGTQIVSMSTGTETLSEIEFIALVGGAGNNRFDARTATAQVLLLGGGGNDTLLGSSGDDVLIGGSRTNVGSGVDSLDGGPGADSFDDDAADTRVTDGFDSVLANALASLPSWLDAV